MENYLFSSKCPVRIQLYRATCFYLAVVGSLPLVISARLVCDNRTQELDRHRLTRNWENCRISITLEPATINHCFGQDGKVCYIAMTYFLKAQLDSFPHDCFRVAWSGLNALYRSYSGTKSDSNGLNALASYLKTHPLKTTQLYVQSLSPDFWKDINWYSFVQNKGLYNVAKWVFQDDYYLDATIYGYLARCVISLYARQEKATGIGGKTEEFKESFENNITRKERDINQQVSFLILRYCYVLRNRSFHAEKPYPVFGLFDDNSNNVEETLTRILLLTIKDTIADLS